MRIVIYSLDECELFTILNLTGKVMRTIEMIKYINKE